MRAFKQMALCFRRYGGQFAYVEIINSMRQPGRFTAAVSASTPVMSVAYLALGAIGYWSQGMGVQEIIIFGTGFDTWSRIAAGAILFQASFYPLCSPD
jgi:vesicular inhibitory amino acid transporter